MEEDHDDDHLLTPPSPSSSFSHLLFGHDDDHHMGPSLFSSIATSSNSPKMLSFEGYHPNNQPNNVNVVHVTPQKSVITSSESSSASSSANLNNTNNNNKKRSGSDSAVTVAGGGGRRYSKKAKSENTASTGHAKRKERLGERISALQQLVSPFGKTDTASVLHEAMGYIRFLHDQVQVLCSPYLQAFPTSSPRSGSYNTGDGEEEAKGGLSSRGLCLIPVESTLHVASTNGADFWSPAMTNHHHSSSTRH